MLVQMAYLRKVEVTNLISAFGTLLGSPKMTWLEQIKAFRTAEIPKIPAFGVYNV